MIYIYILEKKQKKSYEKSLMTETVKNVKVFLPRIIGGLHLTIKMENAMLKNLIQTQRQFVG